jgi:alpha-ketoglutarate-dependent taurine dioxygenase
MTPLTRSGAGALLELDSAPSGGRARDRIQELREILRQHRFALVRGGPRSVAEAVELLGQFGPINTAETRVDGAVLVDVGRNDEVFRSNEALPLHKDGLLTGFDVRLVGIYCVDFRDVVGGRTYISDANRALAKMDPTDLAILRRQGVEGLAVDRSGYFLEEHNRRWYRLPAFIDDANGQPCLHLGLPHAPGERESWRVRIPEVEPAVSDRVLGSLRKALFHEDFVYWHSWREGDLLLIDNYAVLHGREAFTGSRRRLANIQVLKK